MKNKKRAFSLVELLMALVIMGIVTAGMVQVFGTTATVMSRQISSSTRLTTEQFTLDSIYNELHKSSIASIDILNTVTGDNLALTYETSRDKIIFLRDDGRAILREWSGDTPLVGADGIRNLVFSIREDTALDPDNFMLSIDVVAAEMNAGEVSRTAHRKVGFFGQTVKTGVKENATDDHFTGNAIAFAYFVPDTEPDAIVYFVDGVGGEDLLNDGLSWGKAFKTVQKGIDTAVDTSAIGWISNEVWVRAGTYTSDTSLLKLDLNVNIDIKGKKIRLYGGFAGTETKYSQRDTRNFAANKTTLTATNTGVGGAVIWFIGLFASRLDSEDIQIDGFTITNGEGRGMNNDYASPFVTNCTFSGDKTGGGMYNNYHSSPAVTNCIFFENYATIGGGMFNNSDSSPYIENCSFDSNVAVQNGGGMHNAGNVGTLHPVIKNCTFVGNKVTHTNGYGGGICNNNSNPTITDCTFIGNEAAGQGGGMFSSSGSSPKVENCVFFKNKAPYGGGMSNFGGTTLPTTITNCTFSKNEATGSGGGMYNTNSSPKIINCTFSENTATSGAEYYSNAPFTVMNTIFGNSTADAVFQQSGTFNYKNIVVSPTAVSGDFVGDASSDFVPGLITAEVSSLTITNGDTVNFTDYYKIGETGNATDTGVWSHDFGGGIISAPDTDQLYSVRYDSRDGGTYGETASVDIGSYEYHPPTP